MRAVLRQTAVVALLALSGCKPPGSTEPCVRIETRQARIFALTAPASAVAATPVPISAWVFLSGTEGGVETLQRDTFSARVQGNRIIVTGKVTGTVQTGAQGCAYPLILALPKAESVDIPVPLTPGTYTIEAETPYTPSASLWEQGTFAADVPRPHAGITITVQ